jgi:hypothetical protein
MASSRRVILLVFRLFSSHWFSRRRRLTTSVEARSLILAEHFLKTVRTYPPLAESGVWSL